MDLGEEDGSHSWSGVWKDQTEQTERGDFFSWTSYADGSCHPPRAWRNVMALGRGAEVWAIISKPGWFLMLTCHGSLIVYRIDLQKVFLLINEAITVNALTTVAHTRGQELLLIRLHIYRI